MQPAGKKPPGKGSLEIIEEATQIVRTAPAAALACYYTGTLPFVLATLYFWGDMSQSAFAPQHLVEAALGLALLFVWMKVWQARFARLLRLGIAGTRAGDADSAPAATPSPPARRWGRLLVLQLALQPLGLFFLLAASVLTIPFGWVYAFFQNVTVLADVEPAAPGALARKAAHLSALWPKQNHLVLALLSGFALFVFLNLATVVYLLPGLIKTMFGVESAFTRSGTSLLNSTFFAAVAGLTYLCVDPLVKAVYVLRCFYGESLESGEDLKTELRSISNATARTMTILALISITFHTRSYAVESVPESRSADILVRSEPLPPTAPEYIAHLSHAPARCGQECPRSGRAVLWQPSSPMFNTFASLRLCVFALQNSLAIAYPHISLLASLPSGVPAVGASSATDTAPASGDLSPSDLDQAIRHTIQQRKYTWRAPREKVVEDEEPEQSVLGRFLERVRKLIGKWFKSFGDLLDRLFRKLFQGRRTIPHPSPGYSWMVWLQLLLYLLIAAAVAGLIWLIYRVWRDRHHRPGILTSEPIQPPPDLTDHNVGADQLPEDGWTRLARDLLAQGQWRLAIRAFYLAALAHLASRHLISLAKFKSNREYERELRRRAHALPELLAGFAETVSVFDGVWYGRQPIDAELVDHFAAKVDRLKTAAGTGT